jgi:hypothetical protein
MPGGMGVGRSGRALEAERWVARRQGQCLATLSEIKDFY